MESGEQIIDNSKYIFDSTGKSLVLNDVMTKSAKRLKNGDFKVNFMSEV